MSDAFTHDGFHVYRGPQGGRERITPHLLAGRTEYKFVDEASPGGGTETKGNGLPGAQDMGGEGDPGEQTKEDGSSTSNGQVRPLTLGLDSQVSSAFLEGDFQLPA